MNKPYHIKADTKISGLTNDGGGSSSWGWDIGTVHYMLTHFQKEWRLTRTTTGHYAEVSEFKCKNGLDAMRRGLELSLVDFDRIPHIEQAISKSFPDKMTP